MPDTAELPPIGWEHPSHFPQFYYAFNKKLTEEEKLWFYELCIAEFIHQFEKMEALSYITKNWITLCINFIKKVQSKAFTIKENKLINQRFYDPGRFKRIRPILRGHLEIKYALEYILTNSRNRVSHTDLDIRCEEAMRMEDEYREMQYRYKDCVNEQHKIRRFLTEKVEKRAIYKLKYSDVLFAFYKYRIQANVPLKEMSADKISRFYSAVSKRFKFHQRNFDDFCWCFREYVGAEQRETKIMNELIQRRSSQMANAIVKNPLFKASTYPHDVTAEDVEKAKERRAEEQLDNLYNLMERFCYFMRFNLMDELFKIRYYVRHLQYFAGIVEREEEEKKLIRKGKRM